MFEFILTIDYEKYGNGQGSLADLVYEPAEKLKPLLQKCGVELVLFVEVAELEVIEAGEADPAIGLVKEQLREFYGQGCEVALHIHPQWYNARSENGNWHLDHNEYNLCLLPQERIAQIVNRGIAYLQNVLGEPDFVPVSFRAGNWLLQPTRRVAEVLAERGIKVDSSVFKGGLQHQHGLDYRPALRNGYYWKFSDDVNIVDPKGTLLELPIYTEMVPIWRMATSKRLSLQRKAPLSAKSESSKNGKLERIKDFLRFRYPLKLDFCRMTLSEFIRMIERVIKEDEKDPDTFRPLVAIGHTKDLVDFDTVDSFLSYLRKKQILISTFKDIFPKCG